MDVRSRLGAAQLLVAELSGKVVGTVTLYLDASLSSPEGWPRGWAGIRLLAVHSAYRGRGIGRALMEACIQRCRERNIKTIGLHTAEIMAIARKIYERMGFVRAPEHDFHPRPGTVVMAYRLKL
jgi:GNAT superfamily N-acetyltransferase